MLKFLIIIFLMGWSLVGAGAIVSQEDTFPSLQRLAALRLIQETPSGEFKENVDKMKPHLAARYVRQNVRALVLDLLRERWEKKFSHPNVRLCLETALSKYIEVDYTHYTVSADFRWVDPDLCRSSLLSVLGTVGSRIISLSMPFRRIDDKEVRNWKGILPHFRGLETLDLEGNYLTENGAKELLGMVPSSLKLLSLNNNRHISRNFESHYKRWLSNPFSGLKVTVWHHEYGRKKFVGPFKGEEILEKALLEYQPRRGDDGYGSDDECETDF